MAKFRVFLLGMLVALPAIADEGADFVVAFAAAANAKDRKIWEAFLSPGSRACLSGPGKEVFNRVFNADTREPVAPGSKVHVTPIDPKEVLLFENMLTYPDRPTHYFQIDLGPPGKTTRSLIRYGRLQGGKWQLVLGCPKDGATAELESRGKTPGGTLVSKDAARSAGAGHAVRGSRATMDAVECLKHDDNAAIMSCAEKYR